MYEIIANRIMRPLAILNPDLARKFLALVDDIPEGEANSASVRRGLSSGLMRHLYDSMPHLTELLAENPGLKAPGKIEDNNPNGTEIFDKFFEFGQEVGAFFGFEFLRDVFTEVIANTEAGDKLPNPAIRKDIH